MPSVTIVPLADEPSSVVPTLLWNFTANQNTVSSPVVANGLVYVTSENALGSTVTLFCINASTGTQVWSTTGTFLNFALANGYIYIDQAIEPNLPGAALPFFLGSISCLNASAGVYLWNQAYNFEVGMPVIGGGIVYFEAANLTFALNALTGAQIWNYTGIGNYFDSPVLDGANLYVFNANLVSSQNFTWESSIYALDASTGQELWNYTASGQFTSLIASDQNVYVECITSETPELSYSQSEVIVLSDSTGSKVWSYPINIAFGSLFSCQQCGLRGLRQRQHLCSQRFKRQSNLEGRHGPEYGSSLLVNGYLYLGTSSGVYCFNSYNGAMIWKFAANDFAGSSATYPTYADGVIYVGWNGPVLFSPVIVHNFYALEAANGNTLWNYTFGYTVISSPVAVNGTVYIGESYADPFTDELNEEPGTVVALESNVASLPLPTLAPSEPTHPLLTATTAATIVLVLALIIAASAIFMLRKRLKTKTEKSKDVTGEVKE